MTALLFRILAVAILGLVVAPRVAAQDAEPFDKKLRSAVFGEVVDFAGKPWVGAKVTLFAVPVPGVDRSGEDTVTAVTDERGRFRALVLRRFVYSAWAMARVEGSAAKDGKGDANKREFRVTPIIEGVALGTRVSLTEAKRRAAPIAVEVTRLDDWADQLPLSAHYLIVAKNIRRVPLKLDAQHRGTLPPLPGNACTVEVMGKTGLMLVSKPIMMRSSRQIAKIPIPPKKRSYVEIRDIATGKGIPGARIYAQLRGSHYPIATAEKDGVAVIDYPGALPHWGTTVSAKGYTTGQAHRLTTKSMKANGWNPLRENVKATFCSNLSKGVDYTGQIRIGDKPAANLTMILRGKTLHNETNHSTYISYIRRVLHADADGRFVVDGCSIDEGESSWLGATLTSRHVLQLPDEWHRQVHFNVNDLVSLAGGTAGEKNELKPVDLATFCPVMVEVTDHTGLPVSGAQIALGGMQVLSNHLAKDMGLVTDRGGRLCVLMRPRGEMVLVVRKGKALMAKKVHVRRRDGDNSLAFLRIKLAKPWTISGTVETAKKKAVGNLDIRCYMVWDTHVLEADHEALDESSPPARVKGNSATLGPLNSRDLRSCVSTFIGYNLTAKTDKSGKFTVQVPAIPTRWRLTASKRFLFMKQGLQHTVETEDKSVTGLKLTLK